MTAILHFVLQNQFIDPYLKRAIDNFVTNYKNRIQLGKINSFEDYDLWSSVYWDNLNIIW